MEAKDEDLAIAIALYRVQGQKVIQARDDVIRMEKEVAQLQKEEEEARTRLKKARDE